MRRIVVAVLVLLLLAGGGYYGWTRFFANQFASNSNVAWNLPRWEVEQVPGDRVKYAANQGTNSPGMFAQNQFEYRDTLSKLMGRHGLHCMGGQTLLALRGVSA